MPCKVCDNPKTVRCHLMPAALFKDNMKGEKHLFVGTSSKNGIKYSQSGMFDPNLLCYEHEHSLQDCDDYAVRWIRKFKTKARPSKKFKNLVYLFPNPYPDLLLKFVCSVVWRCAVSPIASTDLTRLGPYELVLRDFLFSGKEYDPTFYVCKRSLTVNNVAMNPPMIMSPAKMRVEGILVWEFELGGLLWVLKLDPRRIAGLADLAVANNKNPVLVPDFGTLPAHERSSVTGIITNMKAQASTKVDTYPVL